MRSFIVIVAVLSSTAVWAKAGPEGQGPGHQSGSLTTYHGPLQPTLGVVFNSWWLPRFSKHSNQHSQSLPH